MRPTKQMEFKLTADPLLAVLLISLHGLAAVVIWLLPLLWWLALLLTFSLIISMTFYLRRYGLKISSNSVTAFCYHPFNGYQCLWRGELRTVRIHWRSVVSNGLLALDCVDTLSNRHYPVLLWRRQHSPEAFIRLVKQLKLGVT